MPIVGRLIDGWCAPAAGVGEFCKVNKQRIVLCCAVSFLCCKVPQFVFRKRVFSSASKWVVNSADSAIRVWPSSPRRRLRASVVNCQPPLVRGRQAGVTFQLPPLAPFLTSWLLSPHNRDSGSFLVDPEQPPSLSSLPSTGQRSESPPSPSSPRPPRPRDDEYEARSAPVPRPMR